jgi:integrase/recombinase XerC
MTPTPDVPDAVAAAAGPLIAPDALGAAWRAARLTNPAAELRVVLWAWLHDPALEPATVARMGTLAARFAQRLVSQQVRSLLDADPGACAAFVHARTRRGDLPSVHTRHLRRTTLRTLYRTLRHLGVDCGDPTLDLALPPKSMRAARPLDDDEIALVRTTALARRRDSTRAAAMVALCEAGATSGEVPQLRWADIDLDAGSVALPGVSRVRPRTGPLTDWGRAVLERLAGLATTAFVVHRSTHAPHSHNEQAAACRLLGRLLDDAGLGHEPDVRPSSIRYWAAHRQLTDRGSIEAAARLLGTTSLDIAADILDHHWHDA